MMDLIVRGMYIITMVILRRMVIILYEYGGYS